MLGGSAQVHTAGSRVELICQNSGPLDNELEWIRVDKQMPSRAVINGGTLIIDNFKASDGGAYECRALAKESRQVC